MKIFIGQRFDILNIILLWKLFKVGTTLKHTNILIGFFFTNDK